MVAVIALAMILAACSGTSSKTGGTTGASSGHGGTLTIGINREFGSLNPAVDSGLSGGDGVVYLPYATLVTMNPQNGAFSPGLAQSYGFVGTGNTTYQLKLRPNLKFADGTPLDAQAVKKWFIYFPTAPGTTLGGYIQTTSIDTPNDVTVVLHLKAPTPLMTDYLSSGWGMVVSPKALASPAQLSAGAPGAGPYVYDQSQTVTGTGATYTLVPNKYYYDQSQIKWSKIVIKVISDPAAMLRSLQAGQIDVAEGSATTLSAAESAGLHVSVGPDGGTANVVFFDSNGTRVKALADVRVRQALNYAIDRAAIVKSLFNGAAEPTSVPGVSDVSDPALTTYYPYDPQKAKQLLAQAGYPNGFTFGLTAPTFGTLVGTSLTQAVVQDWANIGVKVHLVQPTTTPDLYKTFLSQSAYLIDVTNIPTLQDAYNFLPGSVPNPLNVNYAGVVKVYDQALTAPVDQQSQLREQLVKDIVTEAYTAPIAASSNIIYSTNNVTGVQATRYSLEAPTPYAWAPSA
jgi:peptide/nickel transport system substrate-binding protein